METLKSNESAKWDVSEMTRMPWDSDQPDEVLVVDDEDAILQEVADTLKAEGFACHLATTLDDAKTTYFDNPHIHIVLCDVGLTGSSGLELPPLLRGIGDGRIPSIVFLTAHDAADFAVEALRVGATDFLTKPVSRRELVAAIENAARVQAGLRSDVTEAFRAVARYVGRTHPASRHERNAGVSNEADRGVAKPPSHAPQRAEAAASTIERVLEIRKGILRNAKLLAPWNVETDILLELLAARYDGREVSATKIGLSVHLPQTTVLRRIERLEENGLVKRQRDETDKRRVILQITESGEDKMLQFAAEFDGLLLGNGRASPGPGSQ